MFPLLGQYLSYLEQLVNSTNIRRFLQLLLQCRAFQIVFLLCNDLSQVFSKNASSRSEASVPHEVVCRAWHFALAFHSAGGRVLIATVSHKVPWEGPCSPTSWPLICFTPHPSFVLRTVASFCPTDWEPFPPQNVHSSLSWNTLLPGPCLVLSLSFDSL